MRRRDIPLVLVMAGFLCLLRCGPESGGWQADWGRLDGKKSPPASSNIVRVNKFFSADPWMTCDSDGSGRINGVRCTVYLEGAGRPKGVFGTGTIIVEMFRLERDEKGRETASPAYEWRMSSEEAYAWRAKEETMLGWGYGLRLLWDPKLDIEGCQVAFVVKYLREDGRTVSSSRQVMRVPARGAIAVGAASTRG